MNIYNWWKPKKEYNPAERNPDKLSCVTRKENPFSPPSVDSLKVMAQTNIIVLKSIMDR